MENNGKGLCIAGLVLGIIGCVIGWALSSLGYLSLIGLALGIVGIILSVKGKKTCPGGLGTAALVVSIIATVLAGIGFLTCGLCTICGSAAACASGSY